MLLTTMEECFLFLEWWKALMKLLTISSLLFVKEGSILICKYFVYNFVF